MTEYVVGFAFDKHTNVALIKKNRPAWQKDHLNGIGGHIEPGETRLRAMEREFCEEAGLWVRSWTHFVTMEAPVWRVFVFSALGVDLENVRSMTDEEVVLAPAHHLPYICLPNLHWLVPMALGNNDGDDWVRKPTHIWYRRK